MKLPLREVTKSKLFHHSKLSFFTKPLLSEAIGQTTSKPFKQQSGNHAWQDDDWIGFGLFFGGLVTAGLACPQFALGLAIGLTKVTLNMITIIVFFTSHSNNVNKKEKLSNTEKKSKEISGNETTYLEQVSNNPYNTAFFAPIIEEFYYRGLIQPCIQLLILGLFPSAAAISIWGVGLNLGQEVAIVCSALIFGYDHLANNHKGAGGQAILCASSGLLYGYMRIQFGLLCSIGMHIANNTTVLSVLKLAKSDSNKSQLPANEKAKPAGTDILASSTAVFS